MPIEALMRPLILLTTLKGTFRNNYNNTNKYFCLQEQLKKRAIQAEHEHFIRTSNQSR